MPKKNPPTLAQHLCYKLYSTSLKMTQLYKPLLSALNLTYPQYLVMVLLWEEEGLGIKDLAQRLQQDSGSVTPLVKRLEAEGYLLRERDPRDERNRVLTLTEAGRALRAQGVEVAQAIVDGCGISLDEALALMSGLDQLSANLDARGKGGS
ncbi:MarR family winged helix-turn-helix transcriptional regulator [Pseudoduganella violacea]|uniref:DNA-binding MarR family transcriptional regulator n=1 Tax=Pseudoduganella violacea TaxID=1715466 RepID=A0A7W5B6B6_9BURK|nr:MarR family transcriptional regulator [Pseudoduganella violacea]MBB3117332.1 DNA-binding MarR family transcriptional regulator [Pseudoduganella violacea]